MGESHKTVQCEPPHDYQQTINNPYDINASFVFVLFNIPIKSINTITNRFSLPSNRLPIIPISIPHSSKTRLISSNSLSENTPGYTSFTARSTVLLRSAALSTTQPSRLNKNPAPARSATRSHAVHSTITVYSITPQRCRPRGEASARLERELAAQRRCRSGASRFC